MTAFAYVFLLTSSLVSVVTAIHSSRTEADLYLVRKNSQGLTADSVSKISGRCSIEASGVRLVMGYLLDDYTVKYTIGEGHSKTSMSYWVLPRGSVEILYSRGIRGVRVVGEAEDIRDRFPILIPFADVVDNIVETFKAGMNEARCSWLVNHIETHAPASYKNVGRRWLKKFLEGNEEEIFEKLSEEGELFQYE